MLNLLETICKEIIGLSKTRWVERHKAYETYLLLFEATVFMLDSICEQQLYETFFESLKNKHNKKWTWDRDAKATPRFLRQRDHLNTFCHSLSFSTHWNVSNHW